MAFVARQPGQGQRSWSEDTSVHGYPSERVRVDELRMEKEQRRESCVSPAVCVFTKHPLVCARVRKTF